MTTISKDELKQRLDNSEKLYLVDVREEWEFEENNIGAINMPLNDIPSKIDELESLKNVELILHCNTGTRSHTAMKYLSKNGFTKVRSLEHGLAHFLENAS